MKKIFSYMFIAFVGMGALRAGDDVPVELEERSKKPRLSSKSAIATLAALSAATSSAPVDGTPADMTSRDALAERAKPIHSDYSMPSAKSCFGHIVDNAFKEHTRLLTLIKEKEESGVYKDHKSAVNGCMDLLLEHAYKMYQMSEKISVRLATSIRLKSEINALETLLFPPKPESLEDSLAYLTPLGLRRCLNVSVMGTLELAADQYPHLSPFYRLAKNLEEITDCMAQIAAFESDRELARREAIREALFRPIAPDETPTRPSKRGRE